MKPHRHAEVIKAWADGIAVQVRCPGQDWDDILRSHTPVWDKNNEYRVKPEPPAKVYPVTQMTPNELFEAFDYVESLPAEALFRIVNFALRHAIDAGQVVTMDNHAAALASTREQERQFGLERLGRRDMAIAEAVHQAAKICTCPVASPEVFRMIGKLNLAAIIATVKD